MKFYLIENPRLLTSYARFSHVGTWSNGKLCATCQMPTSQLIAPLLIEWEPDSDVVGDFSWCGFVSVIKASVATTLLGGGFEVDLEDTRSVSGKTKRPNVKIASEQNVGNSLKWLKARDLVPMDVTASGVQLQSDCTECGQKKYSFKRNGLVIRLEDWPGTKMFSIQQFSRARTLYVTEEGLDMLYKFEFTNVLFTEAGEIV